MTKVIGQEAALKAFLEAEAAINIPTPQPENSFTPEQYGKARTPPVSPSRARCILLRLVRANKATRIKWGPYFVYTPK